jgi:NAD(P)-dependent dehydrogenase (short-subunit alcohol dehydrogenase family)
VISTNLKGPYFLSQQVARSMLQHANADERRERHQCIINIGSISAYTASANRGDYCLSKAGIAMMTALFADRLAEEGIGVYEVRPGVIATDMTGSDVVKQKYDKLILQDCPGLTPIRRWGRPQDVAKAVVAIASGAFPFSTGEVFNVDGGFHLRRM